MSTAEVATGAVARAVPARVASATGQVPVTPRHPVTKAVEPVPCVSPEERFQMISEAAYFRAEQRGFLAGDDLADWLAAESDVDALLLAGNPAQSSR